MTYAQKEAEVKKAVRQLRRKVRTAQTLGEKLERELDRLMKRKRIIEPESFRTTIAFYKAWYVAVVNNEKAINDAVTISQ